MKRSALSFLLLLIVAVLAPSAVLATDVYPTAILPFQERGSGVEGFGEKASDVMFARLTADPDLYLVERAELSKLLKEQELNLSGAVKPDEAVQIGQLTGAKILITGSVTEVDTTVFLVAKIMGTETSRVVGASVEGSTKDDFAGLMKQLAEKVKSTVKERAGDLVAKPVKKEDQIAKLKKQIGNVENKPKLWIAVTERHVGREVIDPAAETELTLFAQAAGFEVIDHKEGSRKQADVIITGEAFSEFASRRGDLVSVKARVEIKAVNRASGKSLAVDRQTEVVVDSAELVAGKTALQKAGAKIALRLLPLLLKGEKAQQ